MQYFSAIDHMVTTREFAGRVTVTPRDINQLMLTRLQDMSLAKERGDTHTANASLSPLVSEFFWRKLKGSFEGRCINGGLTLKTSLACHAPTSLTRSVMYSVPEHLNGNLVASETFEHRRVLQPSEGDIVAGVVLQCNNSIGLMAKLVPYFSAKELCKMARELEQNTTSAEVQENISTAEIENSDDKEQPVTQEDIDAALAVVNAAAAAGNAPPMSAYSSARDVDGEAQFRMHHVEIYLPLMLNCPNGEWVGDTYNIRRGDVICGKLMGIKMQEYERSITMVATFCSVLLRDVAV